VRISVSVKLLVFVWCTECTTDTIQRAAFLISGKITGQSHAAIAMEYPSGIQGQRPCAGSGVVRIDPLRFLAGCRTRRLNQAVCLSVCGSLCPVS